MSEAMMAYVLLDTPFAQSMMFRKHYDIAKEDLRILSDSGILSRTGVTREDVIIVQTDIWRENSNDNSWN